MKIILKEIKPFLLQYIKNQDAFYQNKGFKIKKVENINHNSENDPSFGFQNNSDPGKRNVFIAPANYFDKLPLEIADKIHSGRTSAGLFNFSLPRLIGVAALIAIAIAGSMLWYSDTNSSKLSETVLTYDDILNSEMVGDMDETVLFDAYSKSHQLSSNQNVQTVNDSQALENYLIENNTDIILIINEL